MVKYNNSTMFDCLIKRVKLVLIIKHKLYMTTKNNYLFLKLNNILNDFFKEGF